MKFVVRGGFLSEVCFRVFAASMRAWEAGKPLALDEIENEVERASAHWYANLPTGSETSGVLDLTVQPNSDREPEKGS